ncbi:MAG: hypothetical protein Q4F33_06815 [Mycoplasmatota bacterium]|nr:hypothetical protein [Mycoplasmatota bacterium]
MKDKKIRKEKLKKKTKQVMGLKAKETIVVYFALRFLVIVCMVGQAVHSNWNNVFLCGLTLILFTVPTLITNKLNIELPSFLEITVYLFIFAAEILGEIQNFYGVFKHWDTMLHTLNGFLCAAVGFSLIDIINRGERFNIKLSPLFLSLVAFCFSMTVGVLWEFYEYASDRYFLLDMQKDRIVQVISSVELNEENKNVPVVLKDITKTDIYYNNDKDKITIEGGYLELGINDTMKDLFVNFIGAVVFSILGYLYVKNRYEYKIKENFIPRFNKKI